jgi:hypothetical protein
MAEHLGLAWPGFGERAAQVRIAAGSDLAGPAAIGYYFA